MNRIKYLSIDGSLSNTGIAVGTIDQDMNVETHIIDLVETKKSQNKQVRASSDTIARCRKTYDFLQEYIKDHNPDVIFAETPTGSQSANGMKSYGSTCMLIATTNPPAIEVTPTEVKVASYGNKTASKKDMIDWAYNKYPSLKWFVNNKGGLQNKNEHMADAIATTYAGIKTDDFKRMASLLLKSDNG